MFLMLWDEEGTRTGRKSGTLKTLKDTLGDCASRLERGKKKTKPREGFHPYVASLTVPCFGV